MLYHELDSLYTRLEKAVSLRYETEAISRLEMLASRNRIQEIKIEKEQVISDYRTALQQLNLWLGNKTYDVPSNLELISEIEIPSDSIQGHPLLHFSEKKVDVAGAKINAEKADFLPDLSLQYGIQEVRGAGGFYSYQVGLSVPILSGKEYADTKVARIEEKMAEEELQFRKQQISSEYQRALQQYRKWRSSWQFYEIEVLPLLGEQRRGTLLAFNEGAIDYVEMIQNLDQAVQSELKAIEAYKNYQFALAEIEFYLNRE